MHQLLARKELASWLASVETFFPGFQADLKYLVGGSTAAEPADVRRFIVSTKVLAVVIHSFPPKVTFAHIRDWQNLTCQPIEVWIRTSLPGFDTVNLLAKKPRPETILDDEGVQRWLDRAREVDDGFAKQVGFAILQMGAGYAPPEALLEGLRVSMTVCLVLRCLTLVADQVHPCGEKVGKFV